MRGTECGELETIEAPVVVGGGTVVHCVDQTVKVVAAF